MACTSNNCLHSCIEQAHLEAQARPRARLPPAGRLVQRHCAVGAGILVIDGGADVSHLLHYNMGIDSGGR